MSNTFYVDCNRQNSQYSTEQNNEWTYKLNTEQLLPKGTQIQIQNSFLNKKGINGGSVEIDEDILEEVVFAFYITEQAHMNPVAQYTDIDDAWFRPTLCCSTNTFRGNFRAPITGTDVGQVVYGESVIGDPMTNPANYNGTCKTPDFQSYGGCGQMLGHCQWYYDHTSDIWHIEPETRSIKIFIPKGVYGIGELGQLVEDQFNGVVYYDENTKKIVDRNNTEYRKDNFSTYADEDLFDGQIYNRPFLQKINVVSRSWQTDLDPPNAIPTDNTRSRGCDSFLNADDYTVLMEYMRDTANTSKTYWDDGFSWNWMRGNPTDDPTRTEHQPIRPFYMLKQNFDDGANLSGSAISGDRQPDDDNTKAEYWLYGYNSEDLNYKQRLIGTTNFSFKYDSEKNGFSVNGLHNAVRSPSHDRFGTRIESSGQPVINFKKIRRGGLMSGNWRGDANKETERMKVIGALNNPETRDMGVQIINWASTTSKRTKTTQKAIYTENCARFQDWYEDIDDAKNAWKNTIWARLGFEYEQLNTPVGSNLIYNKGVYDDYGFSTNASFTNDIVPTVSTLANPANFMPPALPTPSGYTPPDKKHTPPADLGTRINGVQMFNTMNYAMPFSGVGQANTNMSGMYSNSLFMETATYPTIIADVGGVVANRLPTLTLHPYYLITTDLCDNYKDNVKKGDVLPLIGVVPKTSLSNQDFITAENQIVQVLSQDKIVNKIHIKILNPDLTAPQLEENSAVVMKITVPNKTPLALLEQEPNAKKLVPQIVAEQNASVGN